MASRPPAPLVSALCALLLLALAASARAAVPVPPRPTGPGARPIVDAAGVLSPEQLAALDARLGALYRSSGVTAGVLTLRSVAPEPIEQFAVRAYDAWRLGEAGRDDGVLLVVAVDDRRAFLATGYGVEDRLPDGRAGALLDAHALPRFREGAYGEGIVAVMGAAADVLGEGARATPPPPARRRVPVPLLVIGLLVLALVLSRLLGGLGPPRRRLRGARRYRHAGPVLLPGGFGGFGGGARGGGWGGFGGRTGGGGAGRGW